MTIAELEKTLKPCRKCGCSARIQCARFDEKYRVVCPNHLCAKEKPTGYTTPERAVKAWNRRMG
jgi:hypothetical protein